MKVWGVVGIAVAVFMAGCASGPRRPEWTRSGGQSGETAQLQRDDYECQKENSYHYRGVGALIGPFSEQIKVDKDLYRKCMRVRGWVHEDD